MNYLSNLLTLDDKDMHYAQAGLSSFLASAEYLQLYGENVMTARNYLGKYSG